MTGYSDLPLRERARRNPVTIGLLVVISAIVLIKLFSGAARSQTQRDGADAAVLHVCVEHIAKSQEDFDNLFSSGAIVLPVGIVFDTAGPAFGPASDPRDIEHAKPLAGWTGISDAEETRRGARLAEQLKADARHKAGLITLAQASLSRSQSCADIPVAAARSSEWGWTVSPVFGSSDVYFQAVGRVRGQRYATPDNGQSALDDAMLDGKLNGILAGVTQRSIEIPSD